MHLLDVAKFLSKGIINMEYLKCHPRCSSWVKLIVQALVRILQCTVVKEASDLSGEISTRDFLPLACDPLHVIKACNQIGTWREHGRVGHKPANPRADPWGVQRDKTKVTFYRRFIYSTCTHLLSNIVSEHKRATQIYWLLSCLNKKQIYNVNISYP